MARRGAFHLLNDGGLHQRPEVPVDHLLLWVDRLGKATQKHRRHGDVLASPSELWGIVSPVHDVALDLAGVTPGAARWSKRTGHNVVRRARWRSWWLMQPLLSWFLPMPPCELGGLCMRVR